MLISNLISSNLITNQTINTYLIIIINQFESDEALFIIEKTDMYKAYSDNARSR